MQDYGIKVNFKQRKAQLGHFTGLPAFSKSLVDSMQSRVPELASFNPVELCNLEYCPERGSTIAPHIDDAWIWGERLVTITLLSSTVMTFIGAGEEREGQGRRGRGRRGEKGEGQGQERQEDEEKVHLSRTKHAWISASDAAENRMPQ